MDVPSPLTPEQLINSCDCEALGFSDSAELETLDTPPGQERALDAVQFGAEMDNSGYNLYLMGSAGVGKHHLLADILGDRAASEPTPSDWCYVADFASPDKPNALPLPAGRGQALRQDLQQLVEDLISAIPAAFQSDEYRRRAQEIEDEFKQREDDTAEALGHKASKQGIALLSTPTGYSLAPMKDGKIIAPPAYEALTDEEKEHYQQAVATLKEELRATLGKMPLWQKEMRQRFRELDQDVTRLTVDQLIHQLEKAYQDLPEVLEYLHELCEDVIDNAAAFRTDNEDEQLSVEQARFTRYRVNLLVDNSETKGAPLLFEDNPNYQNLVGRIEHIAHMGALMTDFTLIRPGVLHRANGGYLVLDAIKLLTHPFAWDALKRVLNGKEIKIESLEHMVGLAGTVSLEPEPIPLHIKVALVGDRLLYYLLKAYDPEFSALFKIQADFAEDMPRTPEQEQLYARLIATLQQRDNLHPFDCHAVGRVIDWAARRASDGERLSLHLGSLVDLMQESEHFATEANATRVEAGHIQQAIDAQINRADRVRNELQQAILRGTLLIDTKGRQLGQVNGLAVLEVGDFAFGSPTRITATARIGTGEVVDIQRETELAGAIHSKGVMTLAAYLASRYARHQPLSVSASLSFEQTYGMVEGDSASLAELCALLSAIADLSISQSLAVTGSVNQHGQVQAIGGVNEKIEGFFDICKARGLDGHHGAIIPASNLIDLMLNAEVREAVAAGQFLIYAVEHVDQAMSLLCDMPAGMPNAEGIYPDNSINGSVQTRLFGWTALRQQYALHGTGSDT